MIATDPDLDDLYQSIRLKEPLDQLRNPRPWFTTMATEYLTALMQKGMRILEWGSGSSTMWFEQNGCRTLSIEHDPEWFELVRGHVSEHTELRLVDLSERYHRPVKNLLEFDIVVIDGRMRTECAKFVIENIKKGEYKPGFVLIFDDSERERYGAEILTLSKLCSSSMSFAGPVNEVLNKMTSFFLFS